MVYNAIDFFFCVSWGFVTRHFAAISDPVGGYSYYISICEPCTVTVDPIISIPNGRVRVKSDDEYLGCFLNLHPRNANLIIKISIRTINQR